MPQVLAAAAQVLRFKITILNPKTYLAVQKQYDSSTQFCLTQFAAMEWAKGLRGFL